MREFRKSLAGWFVLLICIPTLISCAGGSSDQLHIRIRNDTNVDFENLWLGAGTGRGGPRAQAFGAIAAGTTTSYRSFDAGYGHYSNYNFVMADGRHLVGSTLPNNLIGRVEFEPGYYTFAVSVIGDSPGLTIIKEPKQQ